MRRTLLFSLLLLAATAARADRKVAHSIHSTLARPGVHRVLIDLPVGEVHVHNGSGNTVVAEGFVRREYDDAEDRDRNQRIVDDIDVVVEAEGDVAVVRRKFGRNATGWRATKLSQVSVDLYVPPGVSLDFSTDVGEVWLEGTFGNVDIDLRAGEVHVTMPRAAVKELNASVRMGEVHTYLGDRTIEREGVFPGTTHWENPNGGVGVVNVHTTMGEVHVRLMP
jgi:hypothetical protein